MIVIITNPNCGVCRALKIWLDLEKREYKEYDVTTFEGMAQYCLYAEGQGAEMPLIRTDEDIPGLERFGKVIKEVSK